MMTDISIFPQNGTGKEAISGPFNGSDVNTELTYDWVVLLPKWREAISHWGPAWDVHVVTFAVLFLGQTLAVVFMGIKFHRKVFRIRVIMNALLFLSLFGLLRFVFFIIDPYGYQGAMSGVLNHLLLQSVYPFLCGSYGFLHLILAKITGIQIGNERFFNFQSVLIVTLAYTFCMVAVHMMVLLSHRLKPVLLVDSCVLVGWLIYLCVTFICGGFRLSEYALEAKQARKEFLFARRRSRHNIDPDDPNQTNDRCGKLPWKCLLLQLCACFRPGSRNQLLCPEVTFSPRSSFVISETGDNMASVLPSDSDEISRTSSSFGEVRKSHQPSFWNRKQSSKYAKEPKPKKRELFPKLSMSYSETFDKTWSESESDISPALKKEPAFSTLINQRQRAGDILCVKYKRIPNESRRSNSQKQNETHVRCEIKYTGSGRVENFAKAGKFYSSSTCVSSNEYETASAAGISFVQEKQQRINQECIRYTPRSAGARTYNSHSDQEYCTVRHRAEPINSQINAPRQQESSMLHNFPSSASEHEVEIRGMKSQHENLHSSDALSAEYDSVASAVSGADKEMRLAEDTSIHPEIRLREIRKSRISANGKKRRQTAGSRSQRFGHSAETNDPVSPKCATESRLFLRMARYYQRPHDSKKSRRHRPLSTHCRCAHWQHPYHKRFTSKAPFNCLRRIRKRSFTYSRLSWWCLCRAKGNGDSSSLSDSAESNVDDDGYLADNEYSHFPSVISKRHRQLTRPSPEPFLPLRLEASSLMSDTGQEADDRNELKGGNGAHTFENYAEDDSLHGAGCMPHSETTFTMLQDDDNSSVNVLLDDGVAAVGLESPTAPAQYYLGELQDCQRSTQYRPVKSAVYEDASKQRQDISLVDINETRSGGECTEISEDNEENHVKTPKPDVASCPLRTSRPPWRSHAQRHTSVELTQIRRAGMIGRAVHRVYLLTFVHLFTCLLQLYKAFGRYGVLWAVNRENGVADPDPWPWLTFQTLVRLTELAAGYITLVVVFGVVNARRK